MPYTLLHILRKAYFKTADSTLLKRILINSKTIN